MASVERSIRHRICNAMYGQMAHGAQRSQPPGPLRPGPTGPVRSKCGTPSETMLTIASSLRPAGEPAAWLLRRERLWRSRLPTLQIALSICHPHLRFYLGARKYWQVSPPPPTRQNITLLKGQFYSHACVNGETWTHGNQPNTFSGQFYSHDVNARGTWTHGNLPSRFYMGSSLWKKYE